MDLHEKLRKIESLFDGAKTEGEKVAAAKAKERILARLTEHKALEKKEFQVCLPDLWQKKLFVAICKKYGLQTYRYKNQKHTTTMLNIDQSFLDDFLWPEFKKYSQSLRSFLGSVTDELISKIHQSEEEVVVSGEQLPA